MKPKNSPHLLAVFTAIAAERIRQRELLRAGKINFTCESPVVSHDRKLRVLIEEIGEIAEAIDQLECATPRGKKFAIEDLRDELVQTAAVTVAWLEPIVGDEVTSRPERHSTSCPTKKT